jgi:hypothetical protein
MNKKHVISSHVETKIQEKTDKEYRKKTNLEKYLQVSSRSREHEFEADEFAFTYFKNTDYSSKAPKEVFEILKKSHLPYRRETSLDNFFSSSIQEKLGIPTNFKEVKIDSLEERMMNLLSTHPALDERIKKSKTHTDLMSGVKGFIVSEEKFKSAKETSKVENLNQLINDHLYERAIYNAFILEKDFKNNKYYNKMRLRLFYEMWSMGIHTISKSFTNKYGIDLSKASQSDLKEMLVHEKDNFDSKWPNDIYSKEISKQLDGTLIAMSTQFNSFTHLSKGEDARDEFLKKQWKSAKGKRIEKVLIVDPQWVYMDNRIGEHYIRSEQQAEKFIDIAKVNSEKAKLETEVLSYNYLENNDIEKYNDLNLLIEYNNFIIENEGQLIYPRLEEVQRISEKYGTDNLIFLGCYTTLYSLPTKVKLLFGGVSRGVSIMPAIISPYLIPIFAPAIMAKVLIPEYKSYILFQMYNSKNNSIEFIDAVSIDKKSSKTLLNYQFYNYFKLIRGRK